MLRSLVGQVLLQNAQDIFWGLTVFPVCRGRNKGAAMGNMRFFQLHSSVESGRKTARL